MLVSEFQRLLLQELPRVSPFESTFVPLYKWNLLQVKTDGAREVLPHGKTLREAGLTSGSVCLLRGYVRLEHRMRYGNAAYAHISYRDIDKRRAGSALLDEHAAEVLQHYTLDRFPALGDATVFLVDNAQDGNAPPQDQILALIDAAFHRKGWAGVGKGIDLAAFERNFTRGR
jgi:hypothetical protein